jgi:hypothetical protein
VLLPDRKFKGFWNRILHDQTANAIERDLSQLPHCNVTTIPFHINTRGEPDRGFSVRRNRNAAEKRAKVAGPAKHPGVIEAATSGVAAGEGGTTTALTPGITPIGEVQWRQRVTIEGRVQTLRVKPSAGSSMVEAVVEDATGAMSIVFVGRKTIAGLEVGTRIRAAGTAGEHRGRLAIVNPVYSLRN